MFWLINNTNTLKKGMKTKNQQSLEKVGLLAFLRFVFNYALAKWCCWRSLIHPFYSSNLMFFSFLKTLFKKEHKAWSLCDHGNKVSQAAPMSSPSFFCPATSSCPSWGTCSRPSALWDMELFHHVLGATCLCWWRCEVSAESLVYRTS